MEQEQEQEQDVEFISYISLEMSLPHAAFPTSVSCHMIERVAGAMKKWKREMNMSLTQC
jgi:hypothetical protein